MSVEEARALAVSASGLGSSPRGDEGITLAYLRGLGSVQIDTISVVERAHNHILWSRNRGFVPGHLGALEAEPRRIIEYWSHAAAYLPIEDYRYCIPRMERIRVQGHEWFSADRKAVARVRARIEAEGPMRAQDFDGKRGAAGWWDWKPAKRALEYLFHAGELVSIGRKGFQKVYDLAERALPASLDLRRPTPEEMASYYVDLAEGSLGVFAAEDVAYMRKDGLEGIPAELEARMADGRLVEAGIAGPAPSGGRTSPRYYASRALADGSIPRGAPDSPRLRILSPFDPLVLDRKRTARLFGRAYQLECYLPEEKRSFGYFALPILALAGGGRASLAGRLDAKADRHSGTLIVRRFSMDAPDVLSPGLGRVDCAAAMANELAEFAAFNGANAVKLERFDCPDGRLERSLRAAIRARRF